ncbi:hypothetical protein PORY_000265 [Pneumocystis oryctolagi]|uniref:Uncharacterized protein n=1 Tax=Pneumocystis oryctolagi TaxID=42067 RepID=A0ACB7CGH6_9ASCO|nr:hypothetical protein PORY_000265 [Pneumocystis oryctolagi]
MSFRHTNIDIYKQIASDVLKREDLYQKEEQSPEEIRENISKRTPELLDMIKKGKTVEALVKALIDPPYGNDLEDVKVKKKKHKKDIYNKKYMNTIFEILSSIKPSEILNTTKILTVEQQDVLMKYLYKGLADPKTYNPTVLLNWHEKLVEIAGHGCIVRSAFTDLRTV